MRRPRLPLEERLKQLYLIKERQREDEERRRIYNKTFRKGRFFIGVTIVRAVFAVCFIAVCFFHYTSSGFHEETVEWSDAYTYTQYTKHGSYVRTDVSFRTSGGRYKITLGGETSALFEKGDKVQIETNVFGRSIAFTGPELGGKYYLNTGFFFYFAVLFITFISVFFHDGTAQFCLNLLKIVAGLDVLALAAYFLDLY